MPARRVRAQVKNSPFSLHQDGGGDTVVRPDSSLTTTPPDKPLLHPLYDRVCATNPLAPNDTGNNRPAFRPNPPHRLVSIPVRGLHSTLPLRRDLTRQPAMVKNGLTLRKDARSAANPSRPLFWLPHVPLQSPPATDKVLHYEA